MTILQQLRQKITATAYGCWANVPKSLLDEYCRLLDQWNLASLRAEQGESESEG